MAGPRPKYASLKAKWQAEQPAKMQAFHKMLREQIPEKDVAIVGWKALLEFLHGLGVRKPNAVNKLTIQQVRRWSLQHGFPLVRGCMRPRPMSYAPCVATSLSVIAWLLSQPEVGPLFSVLSEANVRDSLNKLHRPSSHAA